MGADQLGPLGRVGLGQDEVDSGAASNLTGTLPKLVTSWERLRQDLNDLFIPVGPWGTHAHHHYRSPIDPERANILVACVVDYESALLFLDTALDATARGLGASGAVPVRRWTDLVNVAEAGDSFSTETNRDILYLQRTVLFSRNKGIAHPSDELVEVTHDSFGNITFWRLRETPDWSRLGELDALLHRTRPDIRLDAHVGLHVSPELALTWIGGQAGDLTPEDRKLFEQLRAGLGYWLPGPYDVAPTVNRFLEGVIADLTRRGRGSICLRAAPPPAETDTQPEVPGSCPVPSRAATEAVERAISIAEAGDRAAAHDQLAELLEANPDNAVVHLAFAESLQLVERFVEALEHYRTAEALGVPYPDIRDALALCHFNLAAAAFNRRDTSDAVAHYRAVLRHDPRDATAHGRLSVALSVQGKRDAALLEAERALHRNPQLPEVHLDVGIVLLHEGLPELALEQFDLTIQNRDDWAEPYSKQAICLHELGRDDEAEEALLKALELNPAHEEALNNLKWHQADRGTHGLS